MPIYEYRCNNCRKKVAVLILNRSAEEPVCTLCGSNELTRLFSRFAAPKSEEARLESLADPGKWGDIDENNPAGMAKFMKKMGKEFGDELGEDFEQEVESAVEEASKGEDGSPDISSPDL